MTRPVGITGSSPFHDVGYFDSIETISVLNLLILSYFYAPSLLILWIHRTGRVRVSLTSSLPSRIQPPLGMSVRLRRSSVRCKYTSRSTSAISFMFGFIANIVDHKVWWWNMWVNLIILVESYLFLPERHISILSSVGHLDVQLESPASPQARCFTSINIS
jgi:hypothetical protein